MQRTRQQVVDSLLQGIVKRPDFPVFSEHLSEVMKFAGNDESSMRQITNIILKDFGLTLKLLKVANSPYYNRSGKPILTVTHAVTLLGLDGIRDQATSLLLFEHFRKKSAGLRELMLVSVLTASHARFTAERIEYPRIEEAYLCGMFRNLGEVLVAGYLPRKYAAVLARIKEMGLNEHAACLRVLECSFEDLGKAAARLWRMPDRVRLCIKTARPGHGKAVSGELEILEAVTSFSHGLTEAIYRQEPELVKGRLNHLMMTHGPVLSVGRTEIEEIARLAIEEARETFEVLRVPLDDLRLKRQTEAAMIALNSPEDVEIQQDSSTSLAPGPALLEKLTEEVELFLCSGGAADINRTILMVLESMYRGAELHRALFGLVLPDRSGVHGRLGFGDDIDAFLESFQFPLSMRAGPVANALLGQRDVYVDDTRYANSAFGRIVQTSHFGILPVCLNHVAVGCFYLDRGQQTEALAEEERRLMSRLRDLTGEAFRLTRETGAA